jgi:hypothetical protein
MSFIFGNWTRCPPRIGRSGTPRLVPERSHWRGCANDNASQRTWAAIDNDSAVRDCPGRSDLTNMRHRNPKRSTNRLVVMSDNGGSRLPDPGQSADTVTFVDALNQLRQLAHHTYKDLGRQTGVPPSTLHDTLTRKRRPRDDVIKAVALVYAEGDAQANAWVTRWDALFLASVQNTDEPLEPRNGRSADAAPLAPGRPADTAHAEHSSGDDATDPERAEPAKAADLATPIAAGRKVADHTVADHKVADHRFAGWRRPFAGWRRGQLVTLAFLMVLSGLAGAAVSGMTSAASRNAGQPSTVTSRSASGVSIRPHLRLIVYNAEAACQPLRTVECGLSVVRDPRTTGGANIIRRVYHGDWVDVLCVIEDGRYTVDEAGVSSRRWYKIIVPDTTEVGWLAAVRTRNVTEVPLC